MQKKILALALAGVLGSAHATDVFRLEGYGAVSRSMGGVAAATDVGPAGMMTNPATLSLMKAGSEFMIGLDLVSTDLEVKNQSTGATASSNTHGNNRGPYLAPELAYARRQGAMAFGIGAFAQGGLGTEYGSTSFLSSANGNLATGLENSSRLLVLNIPLAMSFQATEKLSVGGSVDAMWQGLNLNLLLGADQVVSLIGAGRVNGTLVSVLAGLPALRGAHFSLTKDKPLASGVDAWGYTGRLGLLYQATPETRLGASYTLKSKMADMKGRATLTAVDAIAGQIALTGDIKIQDFQMPAVLNLGVNHKLSDQWTIAADASRVFWKDVMKDIKVAFVSDSGGTLNIQLPQNYSDQSILALGLAYQMNAQLSLRGGYRMATQALQSASLFAVIPATPRRHMSLGAGYAFSPESRLDVAWSHAFSETMDNSSLPNTSAPISTTHAQDNLTLNYTYRF